MTAFALPVAREVIRLRPFSSVAATERRREKLVRSALSVTERGVRDVYCHFQRSGRNLECAFHAGAAGESPDNLRLLGETVRDWLGPGTRNFMWCERLREGLAIVLVMDGRVVKDAIVDEGAESDLAITVAKLLDASTTPVVFCDEEALLQRIRNIAGDATIIQRTTPGSVLDAPRIPTLVEVRKIPAVARWIRLRRVAQNVLLLLGIAAVAGGIYWYFTKDVVAGPDFVSPTQHHLDEYNAMLGAPDPGTVITSIHAAYRRAVEEFGYWDVQWLRWREETPSTLEFGAALPLNPETEEYVPLTAREAEEVAGWIDQRAKALGWELDLAQRDAANPRMRFRAEVPLVDVTPRSSTQIQTNRRPEPPRGDPWHWSSVLQDFEQLTGLIGSTRGGRSTTANPIYRTKSLVVELRDVEWGRPDLANWLASRLRGGPTVLESVVVQTSADAAAAVQITFKAAWCTLDSATGVCAEPI